MRRVVVAIDGPAGAGKSTVSKRLARRLGYCLLDTGAIYRAVALCARRRAIDWEDAAEVAAIARDLEISFAFAGEENRVLLRGEDVSAAIRTPEMSTGASRVSAHPEVRAALLDLQRRLGADGGVVVEGRDIGTVVFPRAEAKFFVTATPAERARRRCLELRAGGQAADEDEVRRDIEERDRRDSTRAVAPLRPADDALIVDTSALAIDEVVERLAAEVERRCLQTG
jgi:CMP/dCMP kinase